MPTNETPTLLPCPFCGDVAQPVDDQDVSCLNIYCDVQPTTHAGGPEAAAAWNTRHLDPATLALARLGAELCNVHIAKDEDVPATVYKVSIAHQLAKSTPGIRERVAELLANTEESGDE
jgi:hypothetical protein